MASVLVGHDPLRTQFGDWIILPKSASDHFPRVLLV